MSEPNPQPPSDMQIRAPVLMPALVEAPFDYLVPAGTPEGALVVATLAGRELVGVVWKGVTSHQSPITCERDARSVVPPPTGGRLGGGRNVAMPVPKTAPPQPSPYGGGSLTASPLSKHIPLAKLKPIQRVLNIPPLKPEYRAWLDWVSDFTLAPKGAVLSLCGLAHAAKETRKKFTPQHFEINLPTLTEEQHQAAEALLQERSKPTLLDGITGSGKTEVYFHAMAEILSAGGEACVPPPIGGRLGGGRNVAAIVPQMAPPQPSPYGGGSLTAPPLMPISSIQHPVPLPQILILLPEIALTHQWLERFEKTFGTTPIVWHSRMTPAAKARSWQAIARGEAQVVVGARSALFLPFANLTMIIVDEEHDPSYKQEDGVLYHARDMAIARAHFEKIPIILVSATPSLETMENVREGKYRALHLSSRYGAAGLPEVKLVDLRLDPPERGDFLSPTVKRAALETLARGEQVLFFLNRRGYAPLLLCRACGHRFQCADCSAWLVVHGKNRLECHHCGHKEKLPSACPACNAESEKLAACGPGVERIAEEVRAMVATQEVNDNDGACVPPPLGGRLGGGQNEATAVPNSAPPHPSPYRGGSAPAAKTLPIAQTVSFAKELRKQMTEAEKKLWRQLRQKSLGVKFRKQHPIGSYIADFVSLEAKLIIEIDGGQHNDIEAIAYDKKRTEFLDAQGFTVLRFWNHEVLENAEGVMIQIDEAIARGIENSSPLRGRGFPTLVTLSSDESIPPETWAAIEKGEVDILVGTQMVAKGHHFPRLTLVVVVDADVGLDGADLRAGERSYQLLHQLGGRAGRGELTGQVLVQTYNPDHPVMKALAAHDRNRLMSLEAKERRAGEWPPFGQLAAILLDGKEESAVRAAGQMLARTAPDDARIRVLGPAPAPLSKLRGQYRYRLLVKAAPGIHLQRTLRGWLTGQKFKGVRIKVDVNPYYFL